MRERLVRFAMRCTSSFFLIAAPLPLEASSSSFRQLFSIMPFLHGPAHSSNQRSQRSPAVGSDFDRHLVIRAADATRLHFSNGFAFSTALVNNFKASSPPFSCNFFKRLVEDASAVDFFPCTSSS